MNCHHFLDNLSDFKRLWWPGVYHGQLYNETYADKAESHALNPLSQQELSWVKAHRAAAQKILDIGCNTGHPLNYLSEGWQAQGWGVDINDQAIERAQAQFPSYCFKKLEGLDLPFENQFFDHIMVHHVLGHVPDPLFLLQETHRLLKPAGTLSIVTPNALYKLWQFPFNLYNDFAPDITVLRYFTMNQLLSKLRQTGFSCQQSAYFGPLPTWCPPGFRTIAHLRLLVMAQKK